MIFCVDILGSCALVFNIDTNFFQVYLSLSWRDWITTVSKSYHVCILDALALKKKYDWYVS